MKNRPHPYRITIVLACWLMASAWLYAQTDALTVNITLPTKQWHKVKVQCFGYFVMAF
ncbi:MAG: hypothetical protein R2798_13545 [Chitinophagales bacterium]|nr:hypothetical protein [Bacteroidota bacterium]MCB9044222.1 hypothetical protein [Chitinophagales bacterium]